jgi:hypothetical protein
MSSSPTNSMSSLSLASTSSSNMVTPARTDNASSSEEEVQMEAPIKNVKNFKSKIPNLEIRVPKKKVVQKIVRDKSEEEDSPVEKSYQKVSNEEMEAFKKAILKLQNENNRLKEVTLGGQRHPLTLPTFNGEKKDASGWLFSAEGAIIAASQSRGSQIDDQEKLAALRVAFQGHALIWFRSAVTAIQDWKDFVSIFNNQYEVFNRQIEVRQLIRKARMRSGQTLEEFLNYRNRLILELKPNSELDKILDLADKVSPELRKKILSKRNLTKCKYEDIKKECRASDLAIHLEKKDSNQKEFRKEKRKFENDKSDKPGYSKKEFKCYSCNEVGHKASDCKKKQKIDNSKSYTESLFEIDLILSSQPDETADVSPKRLENTKLKEKVFDVSNLPSKDNHVSIDATSPNRCPHASKVTKIIIPGKIDPKNEDFENNEKFVKNSNDSELKGIERKTNLPTQKELFEQSRLEYKEIEVTSSKNLLDNKVVPGEPKLATDGSTPCQDHRKGFTTLTSSLAPDLVVKALLNSENEARARRNLAMKGEVNSHLTKADILDNGYTIPAKLDKLDVVTFVDSGANGNFITEDFVRSHDLSNKVIESEKEYKLGDLSKGRSRGYLIMDMEISGRTSKIKLSLIPRSKHQVILGRLWLYNNHATVDCRTGLITLQTKGGYKKNKLRKVKTLSSRQTAELLRQFDSGDIDYDVLELNWLDLASKSKQSTSKEFDAHLTKLVEKYQDTMTDELPKELPPKRSIDHRIQLTDETVFPHKPTYRLSFKEMDALKSMIEEMLKNKWIRPSTSPYGAPVMLVSKKEKDTFRLVVDYRQLNNITVKNRYPLPRQDEMMARLHGAKFFSKLDLKSGYYQIRMHPDDIHKTAFRTRYGHFEWMVVPMGLTGSPGTFMGLMNEVFKDYTDLFVLCFMDDILIYSKTEEEHLEHLEKVFEVLRKHQLYAAPSKCEFAKSELDFLGHTVTQNGLKMDSKKTEAISTWPEPKTVGELRCFIGMVIYYRQFIPGFARLMEPITKLLKGDNHDRKGRFAWTEEQQNAFDRIKKIMISDVVLRIPNPDLPFTLFFDASNEIGIGGVLTQVAEDGKLHPVAFESRKLSNAELKYPTHEKEQLSFVHCLRKWRWYLDAQPFTVFTDNYSTSFIKTQGTLSGRQARWLDILQSYSYTIKHLPRDKNIVSDALSKRPYYVDENTITKDVIKETKIEPSDEAIFETDPEIGEELFELDLVHFGDEIHNILCYKHSNRSRTLR